LQDAATAATEFLDNENSLATINAITADRPLSLIGAAALWSGWTVNLDIVSKSTLVIKPTRPYQGSINEIDD
jgi:hypothetical protein